VPYPASRLESMANTRKILSTDRANAGAPLLTNGVLGWWANAATPAARKRCLSDHGHLAAYRI